MISINELRIPKTELSNFLSTRNIPKVKEEFLDVVNGRKQMFKESILKSKEIDGMYFEFGVLTGGTINEISSLVPEKTVYGFDSFKGLPEDYSEVYKRGSMISPIPKVNSNVELIVGYYENTLEDFLKKHKEKVAFIHIDCDLYSSTKYVLDILCQNKRLQKGTVIQFDEIFEVENEYWYQHEFKAWNEIKEKYSIISDYFVWAGFCHCSYIIKKI